MAKFCPLRYSSIFKFFSCPKEFKVVRKKRIISLFINGRQPLDLNQHLVITIIVTFVGKWVTVSVIHLIHKKAAGELCRQPG
jgi:hypothetical protein